MFCDISSSCGCLKRTHKPFLQKVHLPPYLSDTVSTAGRRLIRKKTPLFFKLEEKCEKCLIDEAGSVHFPQVCLATKVLYHGVLSSGRVQIDLWYKGLKVICTTKFK